MTVRPLVVRPDDTLDADTATYAAARSGNRVVGLTLGSVIPLPSEAKLVHLPGRQAYGMDRDGVPVVISDAVPVAAVLPVGYLRTYLPAGEWDGAGAPLPLFGYTAVAEHGGELVAAAVQSDDFGAWQEREDSGETIETAWQEAKLALPHNRLVDQLHDCAVDNRCYTAQNTLLRQHEGALPASPACNADCLGCISLQRAPVDSPQERMRYAPTALELVELATYHLDTGAPMVSFGQGCEGEPLTRGAVLVEAVAGIRARFPAATIHINTNGSRPDTLKKLVEAGLNSVRISAISFTDQIFRAYYRPIGYGLEEVLNSGTVVAESGGQVCLNLLTFPGVTDVSSELDATVAACSSMGVQQVQWRTLNVDHDWLRSLLPELSPGVGIEEARRRLEVELPLVAHGNFTRPVPVAPRR